MLRPCRGLSGRAFAAPDVRAQTQDAKSSHRQARFRRSLNINHEIVSVIDSSTTASDAP